MGKCLIKVRIHCSFYLNLAFYDLCDFPQIVRSDAIWGQLHEIIPSHNIRWPVNMCYWYSENSDMVVHILSGFALFTELMWVYRGVESLYKLLTANRCLLIYQQMSANQNTVHLKTGFIWKFSREWLLWMGYTSGGSMQKKPPTVKY